MIAHHAIGCERFFAIGFHAGRIEYRPEFDIAGDAARQVDRGYALTDDERPHVERVCRLVSGMPLGIELAAAWASTLPCSEIADEI